MKKTAIYIALLFANIVLIWLNYQFANLVYLFFKIKVIAYGIIPTITVLIAFYTLQNYKLKVFLNKILHLFILFFTFYNITQVIVFMTSKEISIFSRCLISIVNLLVFILLFYKLIKLKNRLDILIIGTISIYNVYNIFCSAYNPNTILSKLSYNFIEILKQCN